MDSKNKQYQNYPDFDPTVILTKTGSSVNHNARNRARPAGRLYEA